MVVEWLKLGFWTGEAGSSSMQAFHTPKGTWIGFTESMSPMMASGWTAYALSRRKALVAFDVCSVGTFEGVDSYTAWQTSLFLRCFQYTEPSPHAGVPGNSSGFLATWGLSWSREVDTNKSFAS